MKVDLVAVEKIIPYARNPRRNQKAIKKVAASIKEFGWRVPIVVDKENVVIAGHTRLMAAQQLGLKEVPVHVAENLTPAQVKAYRIADNRTHDEAEWNDELLTLEMTDLKEMGFPLSMTAFDPSEINKLLKTIQEESEKIDEEIPTTFGIYIECLDEEQQVAILSELNDRGLKCRALIS